jgi:diacylglycerol kinase (ATP)
MTDHTARSVTLLLNPAAGRGRAARRLAAIVRILEGMKVACEILRSGHPGHMTELVCSLKGHRDGTLPVVVGGDGTLNEVINGLPPSPPPLGIIPVGTGNDIAANLGIPAATEEACRNLFTGRPRTLDLVDAGGRLFAGIGGAGVDSEVTMRANRIRLPIPGHAVYTLATLATMASLRPYHFTLTSEEWSYRGRVMFVGIANAPSYGGGMRLSPDSDMSDGRFEVCIVEAMGRLELLRNFPSIFAGTHLAHPKVRILTSRRLKMESSRSVPFCLDGEFHQSLPIEISLIPSALAVIAPLPGNSSTGRVRQDRP